MTTNQLHSVREFVSGHHSSKAVALIGDLAWDRYVFGGVERISPEAPVPVLLAEKEEVKLACAANVAANLGAFSEIVDFELMIFGVVGDDDLGRRMPKQLGGLAKKTQIFIETDPTRPTTLKTRFMAGNHQLLRVDHESSDTISGDIQSKLLKKLEAQIPHIGVLVVEDYAKGTLNAELLKRIYGLCREAKIDCVVDPNPRSPLEFYVGASLITPNVSEAEKILGYSLAKGADNALIEKGCRELKKKLQLQMCTVTRSAHGMTLLDRDDQIHHFPALARHVYDVTGAGDTVIAALTAGIAGGLSMPASCLLATAAASVVVQKVGTAIPSCGEILREIELIPVLG